MPMRGELPTPALRQRWRYEASVPTLLQIADEVDPIEPIVVIFCGAGLLLTVLAMLSFPVSATDIAVAMAQLC